jgi:glycosyltransferase involved in cell wall biosynthesis
MPATAPENPHILLSVVVTCYNDEPRIEEVHHRLDAALRTLNRPYEIVFVNDGSTDRTFDCLKAIFERDPHAVCLDLFQNAGQWAALTAGICAARGDRIALFDSDMQIAPEDLLRLMEEFDKGYDMVGGRRMNRKDPLRRVLVSDIVHVFLRRAVRSNIHDVMCSFKMFNADYIRAFGFGPRHTFRPLTVIRSIENASEIPVAHYPRLHGDSGWGLRALIRGYGRQFGEEFGPELYRPGSIFLALAALTPAIALLVWLFRGLHGWDTMAFWAFTAALSNLFLTAAVLLYAGSYAASNALSLRGRPVYVVRTILRHE